MRRRSVLPEEPAARTLARAEYGANAIEYLMIVALVAVAAIMAVAKMGPQVSDRFSIPGEAGPTTTSATVLGESETRKGCVGRDHAHKGCK